MIAAGKIEEAIAFYGIDGKYRDAVMRCVDAVNASEVFSDAFDRVYRSLYVDDFSGVGRLYAYKDVDVLFAPGIDPFVTNVMILAGMEIHRTLMAEHELDETQTRVHINAIKGSFEGDLKQGYAATRILMMVWSAHFTRVRIIEVGRLQYELKYTEHLKAVMEIHIPGGTPLDPAAVRQSLADSKEEIRRVFRMEPLTYYCHSWLLSREIAEMLDEHSNILLFRKRFEVKDGKDCAGDLLNFLFGMDGCKDYSLLPETTSLQKKVKAALLEGKVFHLGVGVLK